jgi:hypothetical protein
MSVLVSQYGKAPEKIGTVTNFRHGGKRPGPLKFVTVPFF